MNDDHSEVTQEFREPAGSRPAWLTLRDAGIALTVGVVFLVLSSQVSVQAVHDALQAVAYGMFTFAAADLGRRVHRLLNRRDISAEH